MFGTSLPHTSASQLQNENIGDLYRERLRVGKPSVAIWTVQTYREAIDKSSLKTPVKNTLHVMVQAAGNRQTAIDRLSLCLVTGLKAEATITAHWQKCRAAGLLKSKARWNGTYDHTFLIPGANFLYDADGVDDEICGEPLGGRHIWTDEEVAWWEDLHFESRANPPWRDGRHLPPVLKNLILNKASHSR